MGTFLKYVFYLVLIVVVYLIGRGIYEGSITEDTTVESVAEQVDMGSKEMMKNAEDMVEEAVQDYKSAPKKEIEATGN